MTDDPFAKIVADSQGEADPFAEIVRQSVKQPAKRSYGEETLRQLALTGRSAFEGLTALPALVAEGAIAPTRKLQNVARSFGIPIPEAFAHERIQPMWAKEQLKEKLFGGIKPENSTEGVVGDIISAGTGGAQFAKLAPKTPEVIQALSAALSGGASGYAREQGAGPVGQFVAGIAAPMAPYAAVQGARGIAAIPVMVSKVIDTSLIPGGTKRAATRVLGDIAAEGVKPKTFAKAQQIGNKIDDIVASLNKSLPGETAPQAMTSTGNAPMVALKNIAEQELPSRTVAIDNAQKQARMAALQAATPDESAVLAARKAATDPLYESARNVVTPISGKMSAVLARLPKSVLRKANQAAEVEGNAFLVKGNLPKEITGDQMHYIKMALDDAISARNDPGITATIQRNLSKLKDEFLTLYGEQNPAYAEARKKFSELSAPVNQAKVLKAMQEELAKPGGGERVGPFMNVLGKGETSLLKRTTGFPRYESGDLGKVLTPEQMATVKKVATELERDIAEKQLASAGMHKTLDVLRENQSPVNITGNVLERKITITNSILRILEAKGGKKVDAEIARLMMPENKQELIDVLIKAKPNTKAKLVTEITKSGIKLPSAVVGTLMTIKPED